MSSTKPLLLKTRELINAGWGRMYHFSDGKGEPLPPEQATHYCIVGAAALACGEEHTAMIGIQPGITRTLLEAMYEHLSEDFQWASGDGSGTRRCFTSFNDHPDTTKQDVLAVLDKAIEYAR